MEHTTPMMKSEARTTLTRGRRVRGPRPLQHASWRLKREPHSQDDNKKEEYQKLTETHSVAPEARTTLTRRQQKGGVSKTHGDSQRSTGSENHTHKM
uniref:Uncharacterized protein n=1 Tax=Trichogramma kaykai TaxID=54128 RepID=A0ABD2W2K5_9HYME